MADQLSINNRIFKIIKGDITDLEIESFVYYAREDLVLGSGFGTAISMRGGPAVQKELDETGKIGMTEAVVTSAGGMKAKYIIHANGPKFQEEGLQEKLKHTIIKALKKADEKGIKAVAFPPMGAGFYGVPLEMSAEITINTIKDYLSKNNTGINEIVISLLDNREYDAFKARFSV